MCIDRNLKSNQTVVEEYRSDFDEYLDAKVRREALRQRIEERSIRVNAIHRGTKE